MELVTGIEIGFDGNRLTGCATSKHGDLEYFSLKDLYRRGIPTLDKPVRRRIDTNFSNWKQIDAGEYLEAFGFTQTNKNEINHQVFEITVDHRRFVMPALTLMRALFRPTKHLLPTMFMPQALDQVCRLNSTSECLSVEVDAKWATAGVVTRNSDWNALLGWMLSHPTAYAMAGSIHHHAICGRIALTLPSADTRIVLRGMEIGRTMFVTDASVITITPADKPIFEISGQEKVVVLHDRAHQKGGSFAEHSGQYSVPFREDGTFELSDDEWMKIEPLIINSRQKHVRFKLPQRDILDGVLTKLATGTPWQKVSYRSGNWQNANSAFHSLALRGTLNLILEVLRECR